MNSPIAFIARVSDPEAADWLRALRAALPGESIEALHRIEQPNSVRIAVVADPDPAELLNFPNLEWIQSLWAGVESMLAEPLLANLPIVPMSDPKLADTMAEAVLAWTLYLHRDMPAYAGQQALGIWAPLPYVPPSDRNVGILGLGKLGKRAAQKLAANGFSVSGWSGTSKDLGAIRTFFGAKGLREMLANTDILVGLLPHTDQTDGLLDSMLLNVLKENSCLINFGRGSLLKPDDLIAALDSGHLKHAVLDVFREEPLPARSNFWSHPKITVLPHISAPTNLETASNIVAQNIARYRSNGTIPNQVSRSKGY